MLFGKSFASSHFAGWTGYGAMDPSSIGHCPIHQWEGTEGFHANLARNVFHCLPSFSGLDSVRSQGRCNLVSTVRCGPRLHPNPKISMKRLPGLTVF